MTERTFFVIRNQLEQYLDKHNEWQSGRDSNALYRTEHRDEALNTLIEINAKDITLRGRILEVPSDEKKRPVVEVSEEALALDKASSRETELFEESAEAATDTEAVDHDVDEESMEPEVILIEEEVQISSSGQE